MGGWMDEMEPWREQAACRAAGVDKRMFFAEPVVGATAGSKSREREAKAVCRDCPVKKACLEVAQRLGERWGIWGGLTEKERRALRTRQRRLDNEIIPEN